MNRSPSNMDRSRPFVWALLFFVSGCQADCVRRCHLDPVEQDLNRWKSQRAKLGPERTKLISRVKEFEDKVFVNQKAALDLLKADLTHRCTRFALKLSEIKVKTRTVGRVHKKELKGFRRLAESYRILQTAFEVEDAKGIRRGLSIRQQALRLIRGAEQGKKKLERQYFRR